MKLAVKHGFFEYATILRHPEQLLLILGTPLATMYFLRLRDDAFDFTLAACALASSFTSLAINTAFSRRYGSLKYLAVTPLGIRGLVIGQFLVGVFLLGFQIPVVLISASILDVSMSFQLTTLVSLPLLILMFTQFAFLFASVLSAEKVLAFANLVFLTLLGTGIALIDSTFRFLHPIAGITAKTNNWLAYLLFLFALNNLLGIANRKYFKWLD